jgi:CheY-like chemotaxis protein
MRRADSLAAARRHLATYRPAVVLVDVGLPDGSGTDLIAALVAARPRVPVILATSADPSAERSARAAGADGFLPKPVERLADFQAAILTHLPDGAAAPPASVPEFLLPRRASVRAPVAARDEAAVAPDPLALRDDLRTAARVLADPASPDEIAWAARFVAGIALAARDPPLAAAARELARGAAAGPGRLQGMVEARLAAAQPL